MTFALLLGLAVTAQLKPDSDQGPKELELGVEIEILDREIQRQHDTVLLQRGKLTTTQRLAGRGAASLSDVQRSTFDLRFHEAREAERNALRTIKIHEQDVLTKVTHADQAKAYKLLLEWVRAQAAVAEIEVTQRSFTLDQAKALAQRSASRRIEMEDGEIAYRTAVAALAVCRVREAQVSLEMAARGVEKPSDPAEVRHLKSEFQNARLRAAEINLETARRRVALARARVQLGLMPPGELRLFETSAADASSALDAEKKALDSQPAAPKAEPAKAASRANALRSRALAANLVR